MSQWEFVNERIGNSGGWRGSKAQEFPEGVRGVVSMNFFQKGLNFHTVVQKV